MMNATRHPTGFRRGLVGERVTPPASAGGLWGNASSRRLPPGAFGGALKEQGPFLASSMPRRLFIAIDLPKPACWWLSQLVANPPRGVRPVRPSQLHLTLHFLGDFEDVVIPTLRDALAGVHGEPFRLSIRGTGVFPPLGRPSVLWAGVDESEPLVALHAAISAAVVSCGLEIERRPYVPHITLARFTPAVPRAWTARFLNGTSGLAIDDISVERFHLYHSRKLDGATEHSIEAAYPLHTPEA
jgi:2'-5' RNA ligase